MFPTVNSHFSFLIFSTGTRKCMLAHLFNFQLGKITSAGSNKYS